jgi:hypothetical protein
MASDGMTCIPSFMKIGTGIQVIKDMSQKFKMLQCWYHLWKGIKNYTFDMGSCSMIYIASFLKIGTGVEGIFRFFLSNL